MLIRYKNVLSEITQVQIINIPALNNIQALELQVIDSDPIYVITGEHTERIINNGKPNIFQKPGTSREEVITGNRINDGNGKTRNSNRPAEINGAIRSR